MSRYLITGGAGFIGSHLSDYLLLEGHSVTIIDNLSSGKIENISSKCKLIIADINDMDLLKKTFEEIDFCYHLAAVASVQKSVDNWIECHKTNLTATINIFLQASKRNIPVIYASSAAVYGDLDVFPLSEDIKVKLLSPYGVDKYSCELQASVFAHIHGLKTIGLRFFNVYGTRQDPNSPYSGVISIFTDNIKNNKPINIYGDGFQERDFIFIDDVVKSLALARDFILGSRHDEYEPSLRGEAKATTWQSCKTKVNALQDCHASLAMTIGNPNDSNIYNICTGNGISINSLIKSLFEVFDKEVAVNYLSPREGDIYKSIGNPRKAKDEIGFESSISLQDGLRILINTI